MSFHQGNNLADQLNAHFMTSETNQKKNNFYNNFFREASVVFVNSEEMAK